VFGYGDYYKERDGNPNKFSVFDFYPNPDEVDIAQALCWFCGKNNGLKDWNVPYERHMWMMHSLISLRAINVNAIMTDRVQRTKVYDVATQLLLYRAFNVGEKWKHNGFDAVVSHEYVNAMDEEFEYHCPSKFVLQGYESYHDNGHEDRRWKYSCRRVDWIGEASYYTSGADAEEYVEGWYHPLAFKDYSDDFKSVNELNQPLYFYWEDGNVAITGFGGKHKNSHEDRKFYFYTSAVTHQVSTISCHWTAWQNEYDGYMNFNTNSYQWISGLFSIYDTSARDRTWKFYVCE
jgi:hypothetical protein